MCGVVQRGVIYTPRARAPAMAPRTLSQASACARRAVAPPRWRRAQRQRRTAGTRVQAGAQSAREYVWSLCLPPRARSAQTRKPRPRGHRASLKQSDSRERSRAPRAQLPAHGWAALRVCGRCWVGTLGACCLFCSGPPTLLSAAPRIARHEKCHRVHRWARYRRRVIAVRSRRA